MRILNDDEIELCVERFKAMITQDVTVSEVFYVLDSILYDYVNYIIEDEKNSPTKEVAAELFCVKKLRDVFIYNNNKEKI